MDLAALNSTVATIKAIYSNKSFSSSTKDLAPGTPFGLILDKTCFYAESGGQEYDTGSIALDNSDAEAKFEVTNCQGFKGYVLHIGNLEEGQLSRTLGSSWLTICAALRPPRRS